MPSHFCVEVDIDVTNEVDADIPYSIASVSGDDASVCSAHSILLYRYSNGFQIQIQCSAGSSTHLRSNDGGTISDEKREYNVAWCYNHGGAQPRGKIYVDGVLAHTGDLTLAVASSGFVTIMTGRHNPSTAQDDKYPTDGSVIVKSLKVHDMDTTTWAPTVGFLYFNPSSTSAVAFSAAYQHVCLPPATDQPIWGAPNPLTSQLAANSGGGGCVVGTDVPHSQFCSADCAYDGIRAFYVTGVDWCSSNLHCPTRQTCNIVSKRCECAQDSNCPGGQTCNTSTKRCECVYHSDCTVGGGPGTPLGERICNSRTKRCEWKGTNG